MEQNAIIMLYIFVGCVWRSSSEMLDQAYRKMWVIRPMIYTLPIFNNALSHSHNF
jgi:hypothetical protein